MADLDRRADDDRGRGPEDTIARSDAVIPAWVRDPRAAALSVSRDVYPAKAVLAAAYKLSDRCVIWIDADGEKRWSVFLLATDSADVHDLLESLMRELVDQALRARLEEEFGPVRTLIVAQAFAEGNLLDPETDHDEARPAHAREPG